MRSITADLHALGVRPGGVLLMHSSYSSVGFVPGGPQAVVQAVLDALGPDGTLVVPTHTSDNSDPAGWSRPPVPDDWWAQIRAEAPGFDPARTPASQYMGVLPETVRTWPGARRSGHPQVSFAAVGPRAAEITAPHPVDVPHGPDSPPGRVHALGGQILLLGVGHDANTTVHLGELLAGARYRRPAHSTVLRDGRPVRVEYGENDCCCERFALVDGWLDADGKQRRGTVGHADARLARARDVVAAVVARLRENETTFLHPFGVDAECDEARASVPA